MLIAYLELMYLNLTFSVVSTVGVEANAPRLPLLLVNRGVLALLWGTLNVQFSGSLVDLPGGI